MKDNKWTLKDMPDLTGKTMIVTGGNSGLGFASVKAFATKGAEVILACRSVEKGEEAKSEIERTSTKGKIHIMPLDLGSLASVKNFAAAFHKDFKKLDVLLNNAGIMMTPYFKTTDGFEGHMGINHLGHFALTGLLLDVIRNTPGSRIVNVSSGAHRYGKMDFSNLQFENGKNYKRMGAYGRSKLANLLFTYELQRKLEAAQLDTLAVAAHPGVATTNLGRYMVSGWLYKILIPIVKLLAQDQYQGALPEIRAAVDPGVKGGAYYGPDGKNERKGYPVVVPSNEASHNLEDAERLWVESEKLTGVKYQF